MIFGTFFLVKAPNIGCGCSSEPPYNTPNLFLRAKIRKIMYIPVNLKSLYINRVYGGRGAEVGGGGGGGGGRRQVHDMKLLTRWIDFYFVNSR